MLANKPRYTKSAFTRTKPHSGVQYVYRPHIRQKGSRQNKYCGEEVSVRPAMDVGQPAL